ncbi:MAG: NAD(P)-binding protein [Nitrospinae bacterium]|nr:NAD(P)-binding protein [Nitrospinota bacterium]
MTVSNPVLDRALAHPVGTFSQETGLDRIVAFGDRSHKCPVYALRVPPCSDGCPAGEDIRGINNILRGVEEKPSKDKYEAAFRRLTDTNPFPFVMGQVCPAPCQKACNRQHRDETVSINAVEHFLGRYAIDNKLGFPKPEKESGKNVAVVGAGPAGLSAAYHLRRKGHGVTIYEANTQLGGMMRYGTLGYRVSREGLEAEIGRIIDMGVTVKTDVKIGADMSLDELRAKHDAVFLGVGAQKGRVLPVPGSEGVTSVFDTIAFLKEFESTGKTRAGKNALVVGDGDVAMDAARLALRIGAKATILSGVSRADMNCSAFEFDEATHEGATFHYQVGVKEVLAQNGVMTGVTLVKMVKKEKGEEGWNHPVPFFRYKEQPGSAFTVAGDSLIFSIGQATDMTGLEAACNGKPFLNVDHNQQVVGLDGVFGGGDAQKIELITTAIGHGRKAAASIDRFLAGLEQPRKAKNDVVKYEKLKWDYFLPSKGSQRIHKKFDYVIGNFEPFLETIPAAAVKSEAERCMSCGLCFECKQCKVYCPQEAIEMYKNNPVGEVMFTFYEKCVGCHICSEICPTGYIDMGMGE